MITNSNYPGHTTLLFMELGLLKVQNMFKLQILKFYYQLSYDKFSSYFITAFEAISQEAVNRIIQSSPAKTCDLDPIPTSLLKQCIELTPIVTTIVNKC